MCSQGGETFIPKQLYSAFANGLVSVDMNFDNILTRDAQLIQSLWFWK